MTNTFPRFTQTIFRNVVSNFIKLFADDTKIYNAVEDSVENLQDDINNIWNQW